MTGWRHASAFMAVVALLLDAHTGVWAQASDKRTDTFEQRFPPDQMPTPPAGEQPPSQPPVRQAPAQTDRPTPRLGSNQEAAPRSTSSEPTFRRSVARKTRNRATQEARHGYYGAAPRQRETLPIACSGRTTIVLGRRHRVTTRRPQVPRLRIASVAHSDRRGHQYGGTRRVAQIAAARPSFPRPRSLVGQQAIFALRHCARGRWFYGCNVAAAAKSCDRGHPDIASRRANHWHPMRPIR